MATEYRPRVKIYLRSYRVVQLGLRALDAIHAGLWLGMMDLESAHQLADAHYSGAVVGSVTGDDLYQKPDYNTSALETWELNAVSKYFPAGSSILLSSAGGGREVAALDAMGYVVDGFECSQKLVEASQATLTAVSAKSTVVFAPADQVPDGLGSYGCAIVGWGGYMHIVGRQRRIAFLSQFRKHLEPDAPILVSFYNRQGLPKAMWLAYQLARIVRRLRRAEAPEPGDWLTETYEHWFDQDDIASELAESGFRLVEYQDEPYGHAIGVAV